LFALTFPEPRRRILIGLALVKARIGGASSDGFRSDDAPVPALHALTLPERAPLSDGGFLAGVLPMNIASAAGAAGLTAKAVRYYESVGLLAAPRRDNGYRDYGPAEIARLKFLARARNLGFSVDECRALLSLWSDSRRSSADVRAMAQTRIREIEAKIAELESLKRSLGSLVAACHGDDRPDCPIIDDLAGCGHAH